MGLDSKSRASRRVSPSFCLMGPCLGGRKDEKGRGCRCARYGVGLDGDGCSSQGTVSQRIIGIVASVDMYAEYPLSGQDWILVYTSPPLSCSGINTLLQMFFVSRLLVVMGGSYSFAMPTISTRLLCFWMRGIAMRQGAARSERKGEGDES
ncbi:uncharacterized protein [Triticum aestivum]|uniref:uncharacterized protein isoform X3 n=1 Tax=Triticum aestivum TaxID=4565 RepID=UPI000844AAC1|nr:uncharacterized protein LOC123180296 isoform X3 [Triticum aestivum]XP_044448232.1 uncharacterized protein LOC123180296 isoform X3 [Triticum aestivum]XP_044448233.1 uncharacterized protein LOC123180296 isoform X3 [Triticum aestivum]XP_044448234.1 uncharacterized protein LOC123180296 isoform X3 [Triticum aestivum]